MSAYHYLEGHQRKRRWALPLVIVASCLAVLFAVLVFWFYHARSLRPAPATPRTHIPQPRPAAVQPKTVTGRYLFNGTVVWARAVERDATRAGNYAQPFSQLQTFNRAAYDAWFTDFECPITNNVVPYQQQVDHLVFNCRPEFLPEAVKFFDFFDLANNHGGDQGGAVGLAETRKHLEEAGAHYFGNFDPGVTDDTCEVVPLPVQVQKSDGTTEKSALPVALCAWHYFNRPTVQPGEIEAMQPYAAVMPVFAFAEMGPEYHAAAIPAQVAIAHQIIDQGPEFLIANNPHWVQNTEVYKNKLIVYSTGNFIFDQLDTETQRSASIDLNVTLPYDANVARWIALASECKAFHDDCLAKAQAQGLKKVALQLHYNTPVAGQNGAGKITHRADAATQAAVEQRLNWAASMQALGQATQ